MRTLLLALAASSLALSGCGKKQDAGNTSVAGEQVTAQDFVTNDVTAIDAATGADANMAADVEINFVSEIARQDDGTPPSRPARSGSSGRPQASGDNNSTAAPEPLEVEPSTPPAQPATSNSN